MSETIEYIEREALKKSIREKANPDGCMHIIPHDVYSTVLSVVECEPAADVAEVRHGKWIRSEKDGIIFADYECSVCSAYPTGGIRSYYCPNCGAKMD